jgi:hypothetical protein
MALTPTAIAERAADVAATRGLDVGMSKSALYYLWGDGIEGYRRDLTVRLCTQGVDPEGLVEVVEEHLAEGLDAVIRLAGNWEFERLAPGGDDHDFVLLYAGLLSLALDEETTEVVASRAAEDLDTYAQLYEGMLGEMGLRIREPFTWRALASALSAMVEGFAQEATIDPELMRRYELDGENWTLFACAARGVIGAFTQPAA